MANRLSKITTRTGDQGSTGLADGSRLPKSANRIQALGDVDELNSAIGVLITGISTLDRNGHHLALLATVQHQLFDLGGELAVPGRKVIGEQQVQDLDSALERLNDGLTPLREFILPGGSQAAAWCHLARTICRRAERSVVALQDLDEINPASLAYLNRLSDLLFVLARVLNRDSGGGDVLWQPAPKPTTLPL